MEKLIPSRIDIMIYKLLQFEDEDAMLKTADLLLTEEDELTHICGELYQLGYESKMESGDNTTDKKIETLYDWAENKLTDMTN